jgi:acid phosphatase (class A)
VLRPLLTAAALVALTACASASAPQPAPEAGSNAMLNPPETSLTGYFAGNPLDGKAILGPPPAPDSAHGRADRAMFDDTRALEGTPRWKTARQDNDLWGGGALKRFSCALGVDVNERQTPVTLRILHRVELDVRTVGTPAKDAYQRLRPMIGNDKPVCVPREDWMRTNSSYPSGHAMTAWAWGLILAELAPARADAVLEIGRDSGVSRMICGVHFISDVEAGRTLGSAMVARLHAEPAFVADMARAKREVAAAKGRPEGCGS